MRTTLIDVLILTGCAVLLGGLWLAWPPAAVIAGGGLLLAAGVRARSNNKGD